MISIFNPVRFLYDDTVRIVTSIPQPQFQLDHIEPENCRLFFTSNAENEAEVLDLIKYSLYRGNPAFISVVFNVEVEEGNPRIKNSIHLIR